MKHEKIPTIFCKISTKLDKEIEYAFNNLKSFERKKKGGIKKKKWTKIEASNELGKWLYSMRKGKKKIEFEF